MDGSRSREALADFLTYLAEKGLMAAATVNARKAAASKILGILSDEEARDVTSIDVDDVVARFSRLHGKSYTPDSLTTYRSRLKSALSDFNSYSDNPLAFRPNVQSREKTNSKAPKDREQVTSRSDSSETRHETVRPTSVPMASSNILPIPIRADLTIYIQGLPFDLTETEARKIAGVVSAMAIS
ncbi:MAG TPA: hypothetical protein VNZ85_17295 [Caulobacter sp.]|nr:hypothetical protein [Caulobacter sp.]